MRYVATVIGFVVAFNLLWAGLILAQRGSYTAESFGTCDMVTRKSGMVRNSASPKLLIVGGSSVTAGVSATMVEQALGMRAVNFGLHAGLGPAYILAKARPLLEPGDTVVLMLEYAHYHYDKPTDTLSDTLVACDEEYFWSAEARQKRYLLYSVGFARFVHVLRFDRAQSERTRDVYWDMLANGDVDPATFRTRPVTPEMRRKVAESRALRIAVQRDADGVRAIEDFTAWARARRIRVLATWPNTLYFRDYEDGRGFREMEAFYRDLGVPLLGTPVMAMFDHEYFYNSNYHLNERGISVRTERLIPLLARAMAAREERPPFPVAATMAGPPRAHDATSDATADGVSADAGVPR